MNLRARCLAFVCGLVTAACGDAAGPGAGGAGGSGTGGDANGGGGSAPAAVRQCDSDDDCTIVDDCCSCASVAISDLEECPATCEQGTCAALGIVVADAACSSGRCVFGTSCDARTVACDEPAPVCQEGFIPSVEGSCWGACVRPAECREVGGCADCGELTCVEELGFSVTFHCVEPEVCASDRSCSCLGELCESGSQCADAGEFHVSCSCPDC